LDSEVIVTSGLELVHSALAIGVAVADRVLLPSATVATDWLSNANTLDGTLATPANKVLPLLDGVDAALWNPLTDAALSARFDPMDLTGKRHCKAQMQRELQLPERADVPLIVAVDPIEEQFASVLGDLLNNDMQVAIVTRAEVAALDALKKLQERFPDRVALRFSADDPAIHQALGAADLLLVSSFVEPTDQLHRCAQRYGALPVVARVASVSDTVVDCDPELVTGNGFLFDDVTALLPTIQRALAAFARTQAFEKLRLRVMRVDSSWERAARLYEQAIQSRKLTN
jgi:starch synthase